MSSHTIIYLDQNYISNMAKARVGLVGDKAQADFWRSLFDDLKAAVLADKIACPESEFHRTEAMYDRRLEEPINEVIDELSWGLRFRRWRSILQTQIEDAARKFLGKQPEEREPWVIAFESDPQAPVKSRMENIVGSKGRISVHIALPDEIVSRDRQVKSGFAVKGQQLLCEYRKNPLRWSELVLQSKRSLMDGFLGKTARESIAQQPQDQSPLSQLGALSRYNELVNLFRRLQEIGINTDDSQATMEFMESKELLDIPFVDINASIWAVLGAYYPERNIKQSDFYDVPILATTLPYCDLVTTDIFMKEILVKILHFDEKYRVKIFSAIQQDLLAFQKLVREL